MEACLFTSNSFIKTQDLLGVSSIKTRLPILSKKRFNHSFHRIGCTIRSSSPQNNSDDHDEKDPSINPDWRSFRARLVAEEQVSKPGHETLPSVSLTDKWAHPLHEPEPGCLLIATEKLDGVHIFERTVVLLLSMGPAGPSGIILNRPSLMSIKETRSTDLDIAGTFSDRPLFFGGPLEEGLFLVSPQRGGDDDDGGVGKSGVFEEVMKGVYYGTKESVGCAAEMVKRGVVGVEEFRFFDGYCGWEKEQLREEIRDGYWSVVACSPGVIGLGSVGDVGLWEEVLGLVGQRKVW